MRATRAAIQQLHALQEIAMRLARIEQHLGLTGLVLGMPGGLPAGTETEPPSNVTILPVEDSPPPKRGSGARAVPSHPAGKAKAAGFSVPTSERQR